LSVRERLPDMPGPPSLRTTTVVTTVTRLLGRGSK
jgi:hypothetical protein